MSQKEIENSFAGNICRCTGYRSIADAFKTFANNLDDDIKNKLIDVEDLSVTKSCGRRCSNKCNHTDKCHNKSDEYGTGIKHDNSWCVIEKRDDNMIVVNCGKRKWFKTYLLDDVFKIMAKNSNYKLIAGNTGQGEVLSILFFLLRNFKIRFLVIN